MRLGFSKILGKLVLQYVPTYTKSSLKKKQKKRKDERRTHQILLMRCFFFLIFFIKAYVVGTHLNCIDKSMQFK